MRGQRGTTWQQQRQSFDQCLCDDCNAKREVVNRAAVIRYFCDVRGYGKDKASKVLRAIERKKKTGNVRVSGAAR